MLRRCWFLLACLLSVGSALAQAPFHIDRVSVPSAAGEIALSGRLPDFSRPGYQVCAASGTLVSTPLTPAIKTGLPSVTLPATTGRTLVYIVPTGTLCDGTFDATLTNAVAVPAFARATPDAPPPVTTKAASVGAITANPNPVKVPNNTTLSAQFQKDLATLNSAPEPGAPSGSITFTAAGQTLPTTNLVLDKTAVFKTQAALTLSTPTAAVPVIAPAAGTYTSAQSVTITDATPGAAIYYTTDGSTPTTQSLIYATPISVAVTETIKAIALAAGYLPSAAASSTFTITFGTPAQLVFTTQPTNTGLTQPITPALTVAVEDANGNLVANSTEPVTLAIGTNPANGTLSGTLTETAVNGISTFSNLTINNLGTGYTLVASGPGLTSATSTAFNIIPYPITLNLQGPLVGIGATLPGSFTLTNPAPQGGVTVNLASSSPANITITPATVMVVAGGATGSFTYTGVAVGPSTLSASATGYTTASQVVTTTSSLISLGAIPVIAPGQTVDLPLSLATPAPTGGITVHFTSANTAIATITPSIFIPAGQSVAATNPKITGLTSGTSVISATAAGYAPYVSIPPATVTVNATFPGSITINQSSSFNIQLSISYPAPTGGITFTLSSDDTTKVTVPASVTIVAGASSAQIPLTGVAPGQTTIRADSPGITEANSTVYVNNTIYVSNVTTGTKLTVASGISLAVTPPTPIAVTITTSNPAVATVSLSGTVVGTASVMVTNLTSSFVGTVYVQGQSVGTTTLTVSAPGYATTTSTITVDPSGFAINSYYGTFSTTTLSTPTALPVYPAILTPGTLTYYTNATINPGLSGISVPVASSTTSVGTVTNSPLIFNAGDTQQSISFKPAAAGTTTLTLSTPTGFSTGAQYQTAVATVTAPTIDVSNATTGVKLQTGFGISLSQTPPSAETVTVTCNNPAVAIISGTATAVGTATVTFPNTTGYAGTLYVQGLTVGTTTLTISAPGFATATSNITVDPSGFVINGYQATISTTTFSSPTGIQVLPSVLDPSTLNYNSNLTISPGVGPISVPFNNSTPSIGTVMSPVIFNAGDSQQSPTFTPAAAGTTTLTLGTPTGFTTPANHQTSVVTVTAPVIYTSDTTTGVKLLAGMGINLSQTPPNPVTLTVTSSNPAVATVSANSTTVGTASISFSNITSGPGTIYVQGQSTGTATITTSAPGYATSTNTVTVYPSGFVVNPYSGTTFTTTTFSAPTSISVVPALLNPSTLAFSNFGELSPGVGPVSVPFTDSNSGIGTLSGVPLTFSTNSTQVSAVFTPVAAGMTTLSLGVPTGFSTPSNYTAIAATVTAPTINTNDLTTGVNLEGGVGISLAQAPPSAITVTVVSNGPAIAVISSDGKVVGGTSLTFSNVTSSGVGTIYVQGQSLGTTTLTISAPGYSNALSHITVQPAGFVIYNGSFSTTVASGTSQIQVTPYVLNPGTLTTYGYPSTVSPGAGAVSVPITSSNTAVGTIASPLMFNGDASATNGFVGTTFTPLATGTTNLSIGTPAGFSTPSQSQQITATVQ